MMALHSLDSTGSIGRSHEASCFIGCLAGIRTLRDAYMASSAEFIPSGGMKLLDHRETGQICFENGLALVVDRVSIDHLFNQDTFNLSGHGSYVACEKMKLKKPSTLFTDLMEEERINICGYCPLDIIP
jgi:hypothetical protein